MRNAHRQYKTKWKGGNRGQRRETEEAREGTSSCEAPWGIICITKKGSASFKTDPRWGSSGSFLAALVSFVRSVDAAVDVRPIVICPMKNGKRDDEPGKDWGVFL